MPLSAVASLDLYRKNPFRVTGLPIEATAKDISRLTDRLRMFAELGEAGEQQKFTFALSPPPDVDQIRDAAQALRDPERRFVSGFFWFWPERDGETATDPAMSALASGNRDLAYELWLERESESERGFIAKHNLAVLFHLVALDWTQIQLAAGIHEERETEILTYWRESLRRWRELSEDERLWDSVKEGVRTLNEPRLTTGFVRRLADTLRVAIPKINADVALDLAEIGREGTAKIHLGLVSELCKTPDEYGRVVDLTLAPKQKLLRHHIEQINSATGPDEAIAAAARLLRQCEQTRPFFDLFRPEGSERVVELFDEAANACVSGAVVYQKASGDDQGFVKLLKSVLPFANSAEVKDRVVKNINTGVHNLAIAALNPLFEKLKSICERTTSPRQRISNIREELLPEFARCSQNQEEVAELLTDFSNTLAISIRSLALEAWNKHQDQNTASHGLLLATSYARDPELQTKLDEDQKTLKEIIGRVGDAAGEFKNLDRGSYDSTGYVGFAFLIQAALAGFGIVRLVQNVMGIPLSDGAAFGIGSVAGLGFAYLVFRDRWKCIEAFASRFCCGIVNLSFFYVPLVALLYANWRGLLKMFKKEQDIPARRFALVAMAVAALVGGVGSYSVKNTVANRRSSAPAASTQTSFPLRASTPARSYATPFQSPIYAVPTPSRTANVDVERRMIEADRAEVKRCDEEIQSLSRVIERDRIYVNRRSQADIDAFNNKVDRYNTLVQRQKERLRVFNQKVDDYNTKLPSYGR